MIFFKQRSACLRSCSTSNVTRYLVAQFITKVRLVLRTCTGLLQKGPVLKTTARLDSIRFISCLSEYLLWLALYRAPSRFPGNLLRQDSRPWEHVVPHRRRSADSKLHP